MTSYRQEMDARLVHARYRERNPLIHYRTLGQIVGTLYSRIYYGECRERTGCQCKSLKMTSTSSPIANRSLSVPELRLIISLERRSRLRSLMAESAGSQAGASLSSASTR